jgi:hypothetical protein
MYGYAIENNEDTKDIRTGYYSKCLRLVLWREKKVTLIEQADSSWFSTSITSVIVVDPRILEAFLSCFFNIGNVFRALPRKSNYYMNSFLFYVKLIIPSSHHDPSIRLVHIITRFNCSLLRFLVFAN